MKTRLAARCYRSLLNSVPQLRETFGDGAGTIIANFPRAQRFVAPQGGRFFDLKEMPGPGYRLPFRTICIEHTAAEREVASGTIIPYRVVVADEICVQPIDGGLRILPPSAGAAREDMGFCIYIYWSLDGDDWTMIPYRVAVLYRDLDSTPVSAGAVLVRRHQWIGVGQQPAHVTDAEIANNTSDELMSVCSLLALLDCNNVSTRVDPETVVPDRVNRKRESDGKAPIFQYREVLIDGERHQAVSPTGSHASPAWHYRRGHIRRLPDKSVWVRATTVGNPDDGVASHDYTASD